jgi:hypothetical protein
MGRQPAKKSPVTLVNAEKPFESISLTGIESVIPEIVARGDKGITVMKSEAK